MNKLILPLLASLSFSTAYSLAETNSDEVLISDQLIISRDQVDADGNVYTVESEFYFGLLNTGDDCAKLDEGKIYESYRLNTSILSPSKENIAVFTERFDGIKSGDEVISAMVQVCYGIGLKGDIIN